MSSFLNHLSQIGKSNRVFPWSPRGWVCIKRAIPEPPKCSLRYTFFNNFLKYKYPYQIWPFFIHILSTLLIISPGVFADEEFHYHHSICMSWILWFFHFVSPLLLPLSNGGTSHLIPTILAGRPYRQLRITTPKLSQNATSSLLAWVRFVGLPFLGLLKSSYPSTMTVKTQWFSMATAVILSRMTTPKMACCHSNHLEWAIIFSQVAFWH